MASTSNDQHSSTRSTGRQTLEIGEPSKAPEKGNGLSIVARLRRNNGSKHMLVTGGLVVILVLVVTIFGVVYIKQRDHLETMMEDLRRVNARLDDTDEKITRTHLSINETMEQTHGEINRTVAILRDTVHDIIDITERTLKQRGFAFEYKPLAQANDDTGHDAYSEFQYKLIGGVPMAVRIFVNRDSSNQYVNIEYGCTTKLTAPVTWPLKRVIDVTMLNMDGRSKKKWTVRAEIGRINSCQNPETFPFEFQSWPLNITEVPYSPVDRIFYQFEMLP